MRYFFCFFLLFSQRLFAFDSFGRFLDEEVSIFKFSDTPITNPWSSPKGVAVDNSGNIYVSDSGNYRIQKFDSKGKFIKFIGTHVANGGLVGPNWITVDSSGNLYVSDGGTISNNIYIRIQKFDSNGNFVKTLGAYPFGINNPGVLAADSAGNLFAADSIASTSYTRIQKFDSSGAQILSYTYPAVWPIYQDSAALFYSDAGVATDSSGAIFVAGAVYIKSGSTYTQIQKFNSSGALVKTFSAAALGDGVPEYLLYSKISLIIDKQTDNIYLAEGSPVQRIKKFTKDGVYISRINFKTGEYPLNICAGSSGIFVLTGTSSSFQVQKLKFF